MNRFRHLMVLLILSYLALATNKQCCAANYALDNSHTSIIFGISHLNYSYTYGRFNTAKGNFTWDDANPTASKFVIVIDTASIDTNDAKRDGHLKSADFFNANQFPQLVFQSTAVKPKGDNKFDVVGNLTMHGKTKQVTLPVTKLGEGPGPMGKHRCGFNCQTLINRSDFGMTNMIPNIGDQVAITVSFEGIQDGAAGSGSAADPAISGSTPEGSGSGPK